MDREKVSSTNIEEMGYNPSSRTLEVKFCSGRVYQYYDVEPEVYDIMRNSASIGKYFGMKIKSNYKWKRVDNE